MQTLHFAALINAPREKVWDIMLSDVTYREWTKEFNPGSYYKGDWNEGSKIVFLGTDVEGKGEGGMVSRIKENRSPEFISIEHIGIVSNGVEDTSPDAMKDWAGALENYTFNERDGATELLIDTDVSDAEMGTMESMWKKALLTLKEICER